MRLTVCCTLGDSFDIESQVSAATSTGSFVRAVRAAQAAAEQVSQALFPFVLVLPFLWAPAAPNSLVRVLIGCSLEGNKHQPARHAWVGA